MEGTYSGGVSPWCIVYALSVGEAKTNFGYNLSRSSNEEEVVGIEEVASLIAGEVQELL